MQLGSGAWQIAAHRGLAMTAALLLDAGTLFVNQAAIQSIFVVGAACQTRGASLTRWTDALVGGAVALRRRHRGAGRALRRPREQAAVVLAQVSALLRGAG